MKKLFLAVLLGLALAFVTYNLCWAAPFVRCDAYTSNPPDYFKVFMDAAPAVQSTPYTYTGETGVALRYDLGSIVVGTHTVKVQACLAADPLWALPERCSADSLPFTFTKPSTSTVPPVITNMKLVIQ